MRRVSVLVAREQAETARAQMLALFPEGFEEADRDDAVELAAYTTDGRGAAELESLFGAVNSTRVPADWEERWKQFHRPVSAGGIWVVPPWERAPSGPAITIDPARAFGTGAHPTTRLCLELLSELPRGSLLDVGCGSGVLAIAGVKLGFAPVVGVDSDPQAVEAANRNARTNRVELELRQADAVTEPLPTTAVAIANISERLVGAIAPRLACELLVSSGYFEPHVPTLTGFRRVARRTLEGWAADLHTRQ